MSLARRTNLTQHSPSALRALESFNHDVALYLWLGLIGIIAFPAVGNGVLRLVGRWRRREAGVRRGGKRLPRVKRGEGEDGQRGKGGEERGRRVSVR